MQIEWAVDDGDRLKPNQVLFVLKGRARSLLSAERTLLNFIQLLSGTATRTAHYVALLEGTDTQLLDTEKPFRDYALPRSMRSNAGVAATIALVCSTLFC